LQEELLAESLVTLQLHVAAMFQVNIARMREIEELFATELRKAGISYKSKLLDRVHPLQFRRHLRKHLKS
jgi:hypothetical protein